jgi:hypothetical protein
VKRKVRKTVVCVLVFISSLLVTTMEADDPYPNTPRPVCQMCYATVYLYPATGNYTIVYQCGPSRGPGGFKNCVPDAGGCLRGPYCLYA